VVNVLNINTQAIYAGGAVGLTQLVVKSGESLVCRISEESERTILTVLGKVSRESLPDHWRTLTKWYLKLHFGPIAGLIVAEPVNRGESACFLSKTTTELTSHLCRS
jgi:hypothetical protein